MGHHEPPLVAWPPPELEAGAEPELKPPEVEPDELEPLFEDDAPELEPELELPEFELEPPELELPELEPELEVPALELPVPELEPEPEVPVLELEPEPEVPVLAEPGEALVVWVDPGRPKATAPATTTLAAPTAVVVERTRVWPRSLAAMAWRMLSPRLLFMFLSLGCGTRDSLNASSGLAQKERAIIASPGEVRRAT
jgi:hypothetical protein